MSSVTPTLLSDTLSLIQLARETALAQGKQAQAQKLSPVVNEMRSLVSTNREPQAANTAASASAGVMGQSDFRALLNAVQGAPKSEAAAPAASSMDRIQMVSAMSAGKMSDVDIARQLGMTREEVQLILNVGQKTRSA